MSPNDPFNMNDRSSMNARPDELQSFPPAKANEADRKKLKQIYISLMLIGLVIGIGLAVIIILLLNHFGLTEKPG